MITLFKKASAKWTATALTITLLLTGCSSFLSPANKANSADQSPNAGAQTQVQNQDQDKSSVGSSASPVPVSSSSEGENLLTEIMKDAKEGKVLNSDYTANESVNIDTIEATWGKADQSEWVSAAKGMYSTYSKYNIVFGSNKGGAVFEIRSFDSRLKNVSLSMVKEVWGKPAYDVTTNNQEIIGYIASGDYKLLFVFPQPSKSNDDPKLDHYSVLYPKGTINNMAEDPGRQW